MFSEVLELSRVVELGVSIQQEVRRSSSSCPQDWRSPSSGYVYRSRDWENYQIHWIRRCIMKDRTNNSHQKMLGLLMRDQRRKKIDSGAASSAATVV